PGQGVLRAGRLRPRGRPPGGRELPRRAADAAGLGVLDRGRRRDHRRRAGAGARAAPRRERHRGGARRALRPRDRRQRDPPYARRRLAAGRGSGSRRLRLVRRFRGSGRQHLGAAGGALDSALTGDHLVTYYPRVDDDDRVFKALADPTRRHLLDRLFERDGRTLGELEEGLAMTRFGVMKHLRVLEDAGLVVARRSGREKHHFLNPVPIRQIHDRWIDKYTEGRVSALLDLKARLEDTA